MTQIPITEVKRKYSKTLMKIQEKKSYKIKIQTKLNINFSKLLWLSTNFVNPHDGLGNPV